jgi:hypothetical protein
LAAAPAVEKLPAEQQATAQKLKDGFDAITNARKQYATALQTASADAEKDLASLREEAATLRVKIDTRSKALADAEAQQSQQTQRLVSERAVQEHALVVAGKQAEVAQARQQVVEAQTTLDTQQALLTRLTQAQEAAHDALGRVRDLDQKRIEAKVQLKDQAQQLDQATVMFKSAILPLPPTPALTERAQDRRPALAAVACGSVFVLFSGIILLVGRQRTHEQELPVPLPPGAMAHFGNTRQRTATDKADQAVAV